MKKYGMIMFSVLMSMFLILPLTLQAEKGMSGNKMKGERVSMGGWHHNWISSLDLDEGVLQKMQESKLKHKEKNLELKNQLEKKGLEMEKVLLEKKLNFNKILSINDEMSVLRQKMSRKNIENKIEMYKLIPDDKKEEAKKIFMYKFLGKGHGKPGMHEKQGKPGCPRRK